MQTFLSIEQPGALATLGGITVWDRLLRTLSRLALGPTTILVSKELEEEFLRNSPKNTPAITHSFQFESRSLRSEEVLERWLEPHQTCLIVPGHLVIDPRLLQALASLEPNAALIDSAPARPLTASAANIQTSSGAQVCGPVLLHRAWLENHPGEISALVPSALAKGEVSGCDCALQPTYAPSLRKQMRPYWFGMNIVSDEASRSRHQQVRGAKKVLLDATQKGALDIPAVFHAPIEKFAAWHLAASPITPNQITALTTIIAWIATWKLATGDLRLGISIALAVGVLDGVDGKLARLRLETSKVGELEHWLDFFYEWSWWIALAYYFATSGLLPNAWQLLGILAAAEAVDGLMKLSIIRRFGKTIDEMGTIDRAIRLVGGRRNVYVWTLAFGIFSGRAATAFTIIPWIEVGTAILHSLRAPWLIWRGRNTLANKTDSSSARERLKS